MLYKMVRTCKSTEELVGTKCLKKCNDGKIRNPSTNRCITQSDEPKQKKGITRSDAPKPKRCPNGTRKNKEGVCVAPTQVNQDTPTPNYSSTVQFYSESKQFRELSNFADYSVEYEGNIFPTIEHAYQALKYTCTNKPELVEMVRKLETPEKAKSAGGKGGMKKQGAILDIACWNSKKDKIMQDLVKSKINRHSHIRDILKFAKENHIFLVHFSRFDMEWGAHIDKDTGKIKKGENKLGIIFNEFANKM
jgi:ribA/ribD-fused uncharacterized protein